MLRLRLRPLYTVLHSALQACMYNKVQSTNIKYQILQISISNFSHDAQISNFNFNLLQHQALGTSVNQRANHHQLEILYMLCVNHEIVKL